MKGSVDKSSGDWRSDNSVPYWTGTKFNGIRRAKSALQCMHGGVEKHKNNKDSDYCHSYYIYVNNQYLKLKIITSIKG
tara:strand:- start:527 stop:760 length:234 start_codon:yes stop_codon:yes gene_type:complete